MPHPALAWGDEGHKIIALMAEHYLDQPARAAAVFAGTGAIIVLGSGMCGMFWDYRRRDTVALVN